MTVVIVLGALACGDPSESNEEPPGLSAAWPGPWSGGAPGAPLISAGLAIAADEDGVLWAVELDGGAVRWTASVTGTATRAPVADTERVYVVSEAGDVSAFALASGDPVWSVSVDGAVDAGLGLAAGRLFVVTRPGSAVGLEAATGEELWRVDVGGEVAVSPTVDGDVLLIASFSGSLTSLDQATGELRWQATPDPTYVIGTPVIAGSIAVVPGYEDVLYGVSLTDGHTVWSSYSGNYLVALPAIRNGVVYFGAAHGPVHAVDPVDGALLWTAPEVLFGRQAILVPTDAHLLVIELGGSLTWLDADEGTTAAENTLGFDVEAVAMGEASDYLVVAGTEALYGFELDGPSD